VFWVLSKLLRGLLIEVLLSAQLGRVYQLEAGAEGAKCLVALEKVFRGLLIVLIDRGLRGYMQHTRPVGGRRGGLVASGVTVAGGGYVLRVSIINYFIIYISY